MMIIIILTVSMIPTSYDCVSPLHSTETNLEVTHMMIFITTDDNDHHFDCEEDSNLLSDCIFITFLMTLPTTFDQVHSNYFCHDLNLGRLLISSFTGFR